MQTPAPQASTLEIYDTTLRDGAQAEDVSFSAEDKVRVAQKLDELGVQFIEGGWPGANPKDIEFFRMIKTVPLQAGDCRGVRVDTKSEQPSPEGPNHPGVAGRGNANDYLFGKTWSFQVTDALGISLAKNLELIERFHCTISAQRSKGVLRCGTFL